jgi:hypothetical protein
MGTLIIVTAVRRVMCVYGMSANVLQPDSVIEDLICDEEIVTEKYKELDSALLQLSLKV